MVRLAEECMEKSDGRHVSHACLVVACREGIENIVSLATLLLETRRASLEREPKAPLSTPLQAGRLFVIPINDENQSDVLCLLTVIALLSPTYFDCMSGSRGVPPYAPIGAAMRLVSSAMLRLPHRQPELHLDHQCFYLSPRFAQVLQVRLASMTERNHESWKLVTKDCPLPEGCYCQSLKEVGQDMEPYYPAGLPWEPQAAHTLSSPRLLPSSSCVPPVIDLTDEEEDFCQDVPPARVKLEDVAAEQEFFSLDDDPLLPTWSPIPVTPIAPFLFTPVMTPLFPSQPAFSILSLLQSRPPTPPQAPMEPVDRLPLAMEPLLLPPSPSLPPPLPSEIPEPVPLPPSPPKKRKAADNSTESVIASMRHRFILANSLNAAKAAAEAAAAALAEAEAASARQEEAVSEAASAKLFRDQIEAALLEAKNLC